MVRGRKWLDTCKTFRRLREYIYIAAKVGSSESRMRGLGRLNADTHPTSSVYGNLLNGTGCSKSKLAIFTYFSAATILEYFLL